MCGIVGMISKRSTGFWGQDVDMFQDMLLIDQLRGPDSTGAFTVRRNSMVEVIKHETSPSFLFKTDDWKKFRDVADRDGVLLIGHNRKATKGGISNANAHPFFEDHIMLVHNGSLTNHKDIDAATDVDSHAICKSIARDGYLPALKSLKGAWALVWYNLKDRKLYIVRNDERPLFIAEDDSNFYLSSELGLPLFLMNRVGKKFSTTGQFEKGWKFTDPYHLYTVDLSVTGKMTVMEQDLEKELKPNFQPVAQTTTTTSGGGLGVAESQTSLSGITMKDLKAGQSCSLEPDLSSATLGKEFELYPHGSSIIIIPHSVEPKGQDRILMTGVGYMPNKPVVAIRYWFPSGTLFEDAIDLGAEKKLIGTVSNVYANPRNQVLQVTVSPLTTPIWDTTWLGEYPLDELHAIFEQYKCDRCQGDLDPDVTSLTSVKDKPGTTMYTCVCHKCVIENKADMPDHLQEKVNALTL